MSGIDSNGGAANDDGDTRTPGPESSWFIAPPPEDAEESDRESNADDPARDESQAEEHLKDPNTTGADASPEADVTLTELSEDEKDREIRYS